MKTKIIAEYEKMLNWYGNGINEHDGWPEFYTGQAIGIAKAAKILGVLTNDEYQELKNRANDKLDEFNN